MSAPVAAGEEASSAEAAPDTGKKAVVCMVTSAKGGVGKSTVCANLGMALASRGKRVLLIDGDESNRCLDLMTGMQDTVISGLPEAVSGALPPEKTCYPHPGCASLFLLPGAARFPEDGVSLLTGSAFSDLVGKLSQSGYDVIFIDTPGGQPSVLRAAAACCDRALVISSGQATSVRSAAKTASLLTECGLPGQQLIVNQFMEGTTRAKRRDALLSLISLIDETGLTLGGVVPFDPGIWDRQNRGLLIDDPSYKSSAFALAFNNIAARFCHESVPLFSGRREYR